MAEIRNAISWVTVLGLFEDSFYVGFSINGAAHCAKCGFRRFGGMVRAMYLNGTPAFQFIEYTDCDSVCTVCGHKVYSAPVEQLPQ